jgi:hypothetical protein
MAPLFSDYVEGCRRQISGRWHMASHVELVVRWLTEGCRCYIYAAGPNDGHRQSLFLFYF